MKKWTVKVYSIMTEYEGVKAKTKKEAINEVLTKDPHLNKYVDWEGIYINAIEEVK